MVVKRVGSKVAQRAVLMAVQMDSTMVGTMVAYSVER
jgi:hypothetical protein